MALSRIWSAFILIAVLVASFKYMFSDDYRLFITIWWSAKAEIPS